MLPTRKVSDLSYEPLLLATNQPRQFLIEGVDRMGKSTLIRGLLEELGYHLVVHYDKPKILAAYAHLPDPLFRYQWELYNEMFRLVAAKIKVIFDRAHLGEMVYAPMYRKYNTEYIQSMESYTDTSSARLVLLYTSDFSFIQDDGQSIDFSKKEQEQALFMAAFETSTIADKVLVDVSNGKGGYKSAGAILNEVLKK